MPEAVVPQAETPKTPPPIVKRFELPKEPETQAPQATVTPAPETVVAESEELVQDTEEQAPSTEPEAKPEDVTPEQAAKREGRRFERKLDKAFKARAEAEAKAEAAAKRAAELEQKLAEASQPKIPEGKPRLEDFDYDPNKHAEAVEQWAKKEATKEFEAKQRSEAQTQLNQRLMSSWQEKLAAAEDKIEDLDERVSNIRPNSAVEVAIMDAENGPEIANYLLKHPAEDKRLSALPPWSQVREIGKLEAKLLSETPKPKAPSKAPAPITPLTGAATQATEVPSEKDDYKTWLAKRNKQLGRK